MRALAAIIFSLAVHAVLFAFVAAIVSVPDWKVLPPELEVARVELSFAETEDDSSPPPAPQSAPDVPAPQKPPEPKRERPVDPLPGAPLPPEPREDELPKPVDIAETARELPPPQPVAVAESQNREEGEAAPNRARVDVPPAALDTIKPKYPSGARARREEGNVVLELEVLESGRVGEAAVAVSSGYPELDAAALKSASRARFKPAQSGGKPVAARARITVRFVLTRDSRGLPSPFRH